MKIKPINNRILVKYIIKEKKTNSGVIIPETIIEKSNQGIVIDISDNIKNNIIKIGDQVIFNKYSGETLVFNNQEFLIIKEDEILGIIKV